MKKFLIALIFTFCCQNVFARTVTVTEYPHYHHSTSCFKHHNTTPAYKQYANDYKQYQRQQLQNKIKNDYYNRYNKYHNPYRRFSPYRPYYGYQTSYPQSFWKNVKTSIFPTGTLTGTSPTIEDADWGYIERIEDSTGNYYNFFKDVKSGTGVTILD